MKKILALILTAVLMTSALCGCGNNATPKNNPDDTGSNSDNVTPGQDEKPDSSDSTYKTYSDLPDAKQIGAYPLFVNIPSWRTEDWGYGFVSAEANGYAIVVATDSETHPDESIDDTFPVIYNDNLKGILMQFYHAKYDDFTPEITERVTLASGVEALKFEGRHPVNDYGTENTFPVYGYAFSYNDYPIVVLSIVVDESNTDDAKCAEMNNYVDEIVQTIRGER